MPRLPPVADERAPRQRSGISDRLRQGDLLAVACPSRAVLRRVTSRWGVLVLIALQSGTYRFGDLRRRIGGVSERMLAQTLHWLEADGFVSRRAYAVVPPHVEYSLTPIGGEVAEKVRVLADWIEINLPRIAENWPDGPQRDENADDAGPDPRPTPRDRKESAQCS